MATNLLSVAGLVGSPITIDPPPRRTRARGDIVVRQPSRRGLPADHRPSGTGRTPPAVRRRATTVDGLFDGGPLRRSFRSRWIPSDLDGSAPPGRVRSPGRRRVARGRRARPPGRRHRRRARDPRGRPLPRVDRRRRCGSSALDTSVRALVRRLGPRRLRARPRRDRVIDWCDIGALTGMPDVLYLSDATHLAAPGARARSRGRSMRSRATGELEARS